MAHAANFDALRILPDDRPLRGTESEFLAQAPWRSPESEGKSGTPRALRALARIVDGGLCHRCGSCVGICPTKVLDRDPHEYPVVRNLAACTDCDLCVKVCPGDEFPFDEAHREMYGGKGDLLSTHGSFLEGAIGYATDPWIREHSTSGGVITGILLHQLEHGLIDGVVVVVSDEETLWKGRAIVARTRAEVLASMKSKYAITATNAVFSEIRERPGRYALVGLPCQIHGFYKAAKLDERLRERVVLTIGLFCHAAIEHEAYEVIWDTLGEKTEGARRFISRVGKHPGAPHLELADGSLYPVYFGDRQGFRPTSIEMINILYRLFTPARCTTCFDALGEFADIAVGDPWMAPPMAGVSFYDGWSFSLLRTERGRAAYEQSVKDGALHSVAVTRNEALACNSLMAGEKRWRAFRVIETLRRQGKPIPRYGDAHQELPRHRGLQFLKTELHMLSHLFCFLPKLRAAVLRFFLGSGGYYLLWLNSKRRAFRFWRRDLSAAIARTLFGRR